jgi:hypothetical protein
MAITITILTCMCEFWTVCLCTYVCVHVTKGDILKHVRMHTAMYRERESISTCICECNKSVCMCTCVHVCNRQEFEGA